MCVYVYIVGKKLLSKENDRERSDYAMKNQM